MNAPLRIGVNALYMIPGGVGGTEIYLRGLLAALAEIDPVNEYFVFTNRETGPDLVPANRNFHMMAQPVRAKSRPVRIVWEQTGLPLAALRNRIDVLLNAGFTAPLMCASPQVTVFHDLQHKRHPENFRWYDLPFWKFFLFWSAHVSKMLLATSDETARDIRKYYRLPDADVRVVHLGVDPAFFELARPRREDPYLLAVSTLHPHKNLDGLLRAFAQFRRTRPEFRLVVCGLHGFVTSQLQELRESLDLKDAVDFPGWIPRAQVHELYAGAWAFLYPSFFEGFGLPVLEALAAGVPSACSAIEPLSTIAGDAALLFDPSDCGAIEAAMHRITGDEELRRRLAEEGPRQAARFSWKTTAAETLDALQPVARRGLIP